MAYTKEHMKYDRAYELPFAKIIRICIGENTVLISLKNLYPNQLYIYIVYIY